MDRSLPPPNRDCLAGMSGRLSDAEFRRASELVYRTCGIALKDGKQDLVKARLGRRLRILGLSNFKEYFDYVESDRHGSELAEMLDLITTHKTQFFRDNQHFECLRRLLAEGWPGQTSLRFWYAGCSTGEEPYSLAMVLAEALPDLDRRDVRILATDLCRPALEQAETGGYAGSEICGLPSDLRGRYFSPLGGETWVIKDRVRKLVTFGRLNLIGRWPMRGPFHAVFCRNVMIYFDRPTRESLIQRFWNLLDHGGFLFVGFSESLTGLQHRFKYVQPAVYRKQD